MAPSKYRRSLLAAPFIVPVAAAVPAFAQKQTNANSQDSATAEKVIQRWKEKPQKVARKMIDKYGAPQEVTEQRLVWHDNGQWKRTEIVNEEIDHQFPMPHKDMLLQAISYRVPPEKFSELAKYDGSVIVERTKGELAARCDKEEANILALNLAHEIITGKRAAEDAKKIYGEQIVEFASSGKPAPLMGKLNFQPQRNAGDPDKVTLPKTTVAKVMAEMKAKGMD